MANDKDKKRYGAARIFLNYGRAVYHNKFALSAYLAIPATIAANMFLPKELEEAVNVFTKISPYYTGLMLIFTSLGADTWAKYYETKEHIEKHQTIDFHKIQKPRYYCEQKGMLMAAKEHNLEHLVKFDKTCYIFWTKKKNPSKNNTRKITLFDND